MWQRVRPIVLAGSVMVGGIFGEFASNAVPVEYLWRPLSVGILLSVLIGLAAARARKYASTLAVAVSLFVMAPGRPAVLIASILTAVILSLRIASISFTIDSMLTVMTIVFLLSGVARALEPVISGLTEVRHDSEWTGTAEEPVYLVLLDGYPRVDVLSELDIDNSHFIEQLQQLGFEHYPEATSLHIHTHRTLTALLAGRIEEDVFGTATTRRRLREEWEMPPGFVAISPYVGHVTIPGAIDIGPGGINDFEVALLERSAFGSIRWTGDLVLNALRKRVAESFEVLSTTEERRVFAHLITPHAPYLFDMEGKPLGPPSCWPSCRLFTRRPSTDPGLAGTVMWVNERVIEAMREIVDRRPNAAIVVFSDHGMRFLDKGPESDRKSLLLIRDPTHSGRFEGIRHPHEILERLDL